MKSKLGFLTSVSLKRKIKTKWFLAANILLAIVIIGIANIDSIINFFGGDFDSKDKIYVIDNTNNSYDIFQTQLNEASESFDNEGRFEVVKYEKSVEEGKKLIEEDDKNIVLVLNDDTENTLAATLITDGYIDTIDYQLINTAINNTKTSLAIMNSSISPEELASIYNPIEVDRVYLDETKKSESENAEMLLTTVFPVIILPFFMLTIFLVQMIVADVNDEK